MDMSRILVTMYDNVKKKTLSFPWFAERLHHQSDEKDGYVCRMDRRPLRTIRWLDDRKPTR
jgi:hypothetical protein